MKITQELKREAKRLGWKTLKKEQIQPIRALMKGRDCLMIYPVAFGKSAIFQLPALCQKTGAWTLVIEPTLALIYDQVRHLQARGIAAAFLTGVNGEEQEKVLADVRNGEITILYVTPERLCQKDFRCGIEAVPPWLVAVDEAHCVLDWGDTFRKCYLKIGAILDTLPQRPVIAALTATAPPDCRKKICKALHMKKAEIFFRGMRGDNLTILKRDCEGISEERRLKLLVKYIGKYGKEGKTVIYCLSRKSVDLVANYLKKAVGETVAKCHGFMEVEQREKQVLAFMQGKRRIMVATSAFGMGVDLPDIRLVIHAQMPLSAVDYIQQIGRAGRDGAPAHAVLLYSSNDGKLGRYILDQGDLSKRVRRQMEKRLIEMEHIVQSDACLMAQLRTALGESEATDCGRCTNCQKRRKQHERD